MREQLKLLEELQQHDARLRELDGTLTAMPKKLAEARSALEEMQRLLEKERADLHETEHFRREQEVGQKDAEAQIAKTKAKLTQVRNMKESGAVERELDAARKQHQTREEDVQRLALALTEQGKRLSALEAKLADSQRELAAQEEDLAKHLDEVKGQAEEAQRARDEVGKRLRPDLMKRYVSTRLKRWPALVAVRNGTCSGCNMNIPPQLYNVIQRGTTLELCPNCNRIIYWARLFDEQGAEVKAEPKPDAKPDGRSEPRAP